MKFALESEQWKNGVFTYAVQEGLKTNNADKNNDNEIRGLIKKHLVFLRITSWLKMNYV